MEILRFGVCIGLGLIVLGAATVPARAAEETPPAAEPAAAPAAAQDQSAKFSPDQLDQMVSPLALYPDALLMQTLMAATYPLEVAQADRWVKKNPKLKGDDLDKA